MDIVVPEISEEEVINAIVKMTPHKMLDITGPTWAGKLVPYLASVEKIEDVRVKCEEFLSDFVQGWSVDSMVGKALAAKIIENAYDRIEKRKHEKMVSRAEKMERKLSNRARYNFEVVMSREQVRNAKGEIVKTRWNPTIDLKSPGLMKLACEHIKGKSDSASVFAIQNNLNLEVEVDDNGNEKSTRPEINIRDFIDMEKQGILISGGRWGWVKSHISFNWLLRLFPKVIDARAYNHSLNSPLVPGGFLPNIKVKLTTIRSVNTDGEVINAETDGCGRIHPDHELYKQLQRPGGACVIQFRYINVKGAFAKGILVPDERCVSNDGNPEIWLDWAQVKGAGKNDAAKCQASNRDVYQHGFIGVIQCWDRPRQLKWSFEQLQMFNVNPTTTRIIEEWVEEAYAKLLGEGIEGLLSGIAMDNPQLKLILQLVAVMNHQGSDFSAVSIQMIKNAVIERLQKTLYFIAQGAGKNGKQMVAVMDAGVPEGTIVCAGIAPGTELIVHRFPTLLPQGILKLKVVKPYAHHMIQGQVLRNAVYMNPKDLVDRIQGDSDGDIVGITTDSRVLELAKHVIGKGNVYLVEPKGEKFATTTHSSEGQRYMRTDPRGNVGGMCIHQSKMFAIQDLDAAIAMAFPYQEAVDVAKKKIEWTDFRAAAHAENWNYDPQTNRYSFDMRMNADEYEGDDLPEEMIKDWINGRLRDAGIVDPKKQNVLAWRHSNKRIDPATWSDCATRGNWQGGNLVHYCHDYALKMWQQYAERFNFNVEATPIAHILQLLLNTYGVSINPIQTTWPEYMKGLRVKSGLRTFGQTMQKIMSNNYTEADRQQRIDTATILLHSNLGKLTVEELELIWRMELTDMFVHVDPNNHRNRTWSIVPPEHANTPEEKAKVRVNNPNHAFRAIAWHGSPIMVLLGINAAQECDFLKRNMQMEYEGRTYDGTRLEVLVSIAMLDANPQAKMTSMIFNSHLHGTEMKDSSGAPIHGRDCQHCITTLHNTLVQSLRSSRASVEHEFIKKMCKNLNHND